jgi:hypothetical protein
MSVAEWPEAVSCAVPLLVVISLFHCLFSAQSTARSRGTQLNSRWLVTALCSASAAMPLLSCPSFLLIHSTLTRRCIVRESHRKRGADLKEHRIPAKLYVHDLAFRQSVLRTDARSVHKFKPAERVFRARQYEDEPSGSTEK